MNKIERILNCLLENLDEGIQVVDNKGKTIYYNDAMARMEGQKKEEIIGKGIHEYLKDVKEESSTLMNALKHKEKIVDVIQHYSNHYKKNITTINTTVPVIIDNEVVAAVEIARDMTQLKELNEKICKFQANEELINKNYNFKDIIGNSEVIRNAINKAMRASLSNSTVLICGETGSGKEVFAQSIHYNGIRQDKPFIAVNCAAIPSALLEGMFFGTVKGSFTGAENKKGLFEEAHRGTLLLDEVNSLEPYLQSKLLRVLQDGYIRPIGSNRTIDVDVRVVASLNEDPEELIKQGKLRKDFYYRLSVIRIDIPPLRERKEDIIELTDYFIKYYNNILKKNITGVDQKVYETFENYNWPGNIRQLKNTIEAAMNMANSNTKLTNEYFDEKIQKQKINSGDLGDKSITQYIEEIEKSIIETKLNESNGNISKAANKLKISRQKLQYKLKKYNL